MTIVNFFQAISGHPDNIYDVDAIKSESESQDGLSDSDDPRDTASILRLIMEIFPLVYVVNLIGDSIQSAHISR